LGWRERDWARFNDEEWEAIYGPGRRVPTRQADWTRRIVYSAIGVVVLLAVAFGAKLRVPGGPAMPTAGASPVVLYGIPGSDSTINENSPNGTNTVCTEMAVPRTTGRWYCVTWEINMSHATVIQPRPYDGPCAHATIDQRRAAWTCLTVAPYPDDHVPENLLGPPLPQS
jgi:hypothetical protein